MSSENNAADRKALDDAKRKVLAEKRAHEIVKLMLEENITQEFFTSSITYLSNQHYQDVTEERAILKLCGYPLCDNPLCHIPKQQYKISGNRVYDLSDRKKFCSNSCYKSSEHVALQIPSTPLWLRSRKSVDPITLDRDPSGLKGKEIHLRHVVQSSDIEITTDGDLPESIVVPQNAYEEEINVGPSRGVADPKCRKTNSVSQTKLQSPPEAVVLQNTFSTVDSWLTEKSVLFLRDPSNFNVKTNVASASEGFTTDEVRINEKMQLLEERIMKINTGYKSFDSAKRSVQTEDNDTQVYAGRVEQYFRGQLEHRPKCDGSDDKPVELPTVDSRDQMIIRKRILYQKLNKIMQDLVPNLPVGSVSLLLKDLISTFSLNSHNVMIKTSEVPLIAITLLFLLRSNHEAMKSSLEQSQGVIEALLKSLNLNAFSVEEFVERTLFKSR